MTQRPFIDAHVHLWDRGHLPYPWLDDPAMMSIASTYHIADYRDEASAWNVIGCVHVEAGTQAGRSQDETRWLEGFSAEYGWPNVLVAHAPLDAPDIEAQLEWQASRPMVRGIRHIVNWHPDPARQAYPTDLTENADWQRGFGRLGALGMSYDFHGHPPQLGNLAKVARKHDDTPLIINHLGLPSLTDGLEQWRQGLHALVELPQSSIKISGAGFIASPFNVDDFRDILLEVVDLFTPARCMIAGNFPTDRLFASMDETLAAYDAIFAGFSDDEQRQLWGGTANRVYRMGLGL
jgi:predicted TIM-barrel fold metal-dependent hydrolase